MSVTDSAKKSKWLKRSLIALGAIVLVALVFGAGFFTGRASTFRSSPLAAFGRVPGFRGAHGASGTIQEIANDTIRIQTRDGKTQIILINSDTRFDKSFQKISASDLKVGDRIIVIGSPNDEGQIVARLIGLVDSSTPTRDSGFPPRP